MSSRSFLQRDVMAAAADDVRPLKRVQSYEFLPPSMSEFRVVLLGNSWSERSSVGNLILGRPAFDPEKEPDCCLREQGQIKEKDIVLINTPDLIHGDVSEDRLTEHVDSCMRLSRPGPHVFLLVLQPEDFTEEQRLRLCRVLQLFNHQSFNQSLLLISAPRKEGPGSPQTLRPDQPLKDMMVTCRYRYLRRENDDLHELLTRLGQTAVESSREHGSSSGLDVADAGLLMKPTSDTEQMKPVLNLVLCGHTAAAGAILGQTDPHPVSSSSQRVKHQVCGRWVSLVELPALSGKPLEDVMKESLRCVSLFDPEGVHVFILVLPVGPLTDEDKREFETIVNTFGSQVKAFTMTLFTVDADPSAPEVVTSPKEDKDIQTLIQSCGGHFVLNIRDRQQIPELLDSLEKHRAETEHEAVSYTTETFAQAQIEKIIQQAELKNLKQSSSTGLISMMASPYTSIRNWLGATGSQTESPKGNVEYQSPGLRIVLFGKDEIKKTKLLNFIRGTDLDSQTHQSVNQCSGFVTEWKGNRLTVVKTPDMFHLPKDAVIQEMRSCVSLCPPGPNVLLLLTSSSDFTEKNRKTLEFILGLFNQDAFKHLMIVNTHKGINFKLPLNKVLKKCGRKIYNMADENHLLLMTQIESIVHANNQSFLTLKEESIRYELLRTPLNIVLCGSRGAEKTSAARAILGRADLRLVSGSSECVKLRAGVCGRQVSLVELPELCGRPLETVMKVSLSSVSLCDPEGVHVFILVLPVGPLTDEDKREFETIMNTFGSQVKAFTMTLFTVDADPSAPKVVNYMKKDKDIQELIQSCGGHFVLNIRDRQQIPELLDRLEKLRAETEHEAVSYTTETFAQAQIEKISIQQAELQSLKQSSTTGGDMKQSPESLRIVLLGKTGCGKSSSGNTILGRKEFEAKFGQKSGTRFCQKAHGEVNGRPVTVVDTPGLFDTALSNDQIYEEMIKCISLLAPGPHVFLLVVNIGRFTEEEKMTVKRIKEGFGRNAEKFTIVLITGGDQLKEEDMTIDEYIETSCTDSFKKLISDCGGRYHLFDNRDYKNQTQVSELITKIDEMVKENGGSCYTNAMLQEAETAIKKEMEKLLKQKEEEMRKEMEELKMKHDEEKMAMEREIEKQRAEIEKQRKLREKQLEDMKEKINKEKEERERDQKRREEEERRRKEQEDIQRQEWSQKLADSEKQIQIKSEEKQMTDTKLLETREELQRKQDNWEKQLKDWWEERYRENEQIRHEEQTKLKKFEEEYRREKENDEKKRKEEDKLRQQEEERLRKTMEEEHERKMKDLKKTNEEEARKKAEEVNDFKEKYKKDIETLKETQEKEIKDKDEKYDLLKALSELKEQELKEKQRGVIVNILKSLMKKRRNLQKITELQRKQEEEMNKETTEEGKKILQEKHEEELSQLLEELLTEENTWYGILVDLYHRVFWRP